MNIQNFDNTTLFSGSKTRRKSVVQKYALNQNLGLCDAIVDKFTHNRQKSIDTLQKYKSGEITREDLELELKRRYNARKETGELITDTAVSALSLTAYKNIDQFSSVTELFKKGLGQKTKGIAICASVLTGLIAKPVLTGIDKLGEGKDRSHRPSLFNRFAMGALNGLASPILATSSLFVTIPALLGINTSARYLTGRNDKSLHEYLQTQKDSIGVHLFATVPELAVLGYKGKGVIKSWDLACKKAKENSQALKEFQNPHKKDFDLETLSENLDLKTKIEYYLKLLPVFNDPSADKIIDTNIFIAKFLQTLPDQKIESWDKIYGKDIQPKLISAIKDLKGGCPRSYTVDEAQGLISATYGKKYSIIRDEPLGVGTIAETYLAKENKTGREVVIKLLKKGINEEKIEADRLQAQELLAKSEFRKNKEEFTYYKKFIDVMYAAWSKECDLSLEKEAAEIMASNAKRFNVVKPIEIKNNIYVMDKAKGVQLNKLDEELKRRDIKLTEEQVKKLLLNYNKVFIEQLISIPRSGQKIIQADPNSANIFIDLDNLEKPITFLDLGNVLRYDNLTATRNALGHLDFIFGNSRGIAETNLEGAILPEGLSRKDAIEKLVKELETHIFNNKTQIPPPNTITDFCVDVMKNMKIIPNADNANLIKAETTYYSNIFELRHKIQDGLVQEIAGSEGFGDKLKLMLTEMKQTGDFQNLVRCILSEIFNSVKNASFTTQKHAYNELKEKINYLENNKEKALTTFYSLIN
ncbi:MAG: AarF/UbiB family protein [Fusobacterium sp.]|nr:AarF/UbiB family protein [Fusobacterium sp.]